MIGSDAIRGYNDTFILSILLAGDSYGYAISKQIREISEGEYSIKETTLYSAFNRLEKNGYIVNHFQEKSPTVKKELTTKSPQTANTI